MPGDRAITYIVPFPAGGLTDVMARLVGQEPSNAWKKPVVVDNRAGGNGNIGATPAARAPADGYTFLAITLTHAVTSHSRHPLLPDVPTMVEAGYPDVIVENWTGLLVPAGTPKDVVAKIAGEALTAVKKPEVQERIRAQGFQVTGLGPEQFGALLREEVPRWRKVIETARIQVE